MLGQYGLCGLNHHLVEWPPTIRLRSNRTGHCSDQGLFCTDFLQVFLDCFDRGCPDVLIFPTTNLKQLEGALEDRLSPSALLPHCCPLLRLTLHGLLNELVLSIGLLCRLGSCLARVLRRQSLNRRRLHHCGGLVHGRLDRVKLSGGRLCHGGRLLTSLLRVLVRILQSGCQEDAACARRRAWETLQEDLPCVRRDGLQGLDDIADEGDVRGLHPSFGGCCA
mmetsp:Transcript_49221/g.123955  ORF Transcript_49221/g.123955 Transcript_49221/m.123955 type:complete len:222 (+) Transcript_49221:587-1252(+)